MLASGWWKNRMQRRHKDRFRQDDLSLSSFLGTSLIHGRAFSDFPPSSHGRARSGLCGGTSMGSEDVACGLKTDAPMASKRNTKAF